MDEARIQGVATEHLKQLDAARLAASARRGIADPPTCGAQSQVALRCSSLVPPGSGTAALVSARRQAGRTPASARTERCAGS